MKINEIQIKGFKTIKDLSIQPGGINVLVGRNNTGKTSLLEAIFYTISEDLNTLKEEYASRLSSLINVEEPESNILIRSDRGNKSLRLSKPENIELCEEIKKDIERIAEHSRHGPFGKGKIVEKSREVVSSISEDAKLIDSLKNSSIKFETKDKKRILVDYDRESRQLSKHAKPLSETLFSKRFEIRSISTFFIGLLKGPYEDKPDLSTINFIDYLEMDLEMSNKEPSKSKINEIENYLKENVSGNLIRFDFDKLLFRGENGNSYEVPYESMGDGYQALVDLIMQIEKENKIVLLEEPENHMHPHYMKKLLNEVIKIAKKCEIQLFISTHSFDVLEFLFGKPSEREEFLKPEHQQYLDQELKLIRLERHEKNVLAAAQLNREEARTELEEIRMDLRGFSE